MNSSTTTKIDFCGRFAPSPSGPLHFGSLVTALASFVDVKANKGVWWLRIDDIDRDRSKSNFNKTIQIQLSDHGFIWDRWPVEKGGVSGVMFQSKRSWWYSSTSQRRSDTSTNASISIRRTTSNAIMVLLFDKKYEGPACRSFCNCGTYTSFV